MKRNDKQRLLEVMKRLDKTFKPINEEFYGENRKGCFSDKIKIGTDQEVKLDEYDNYNYPAGADADPNAPWNQSKDDEEDEYEPEYEHDDMDEAIDEYCRGMNEVDQQGGDDQAIIADILSVNEGIGDIVSKVVEYGKKGLLTAAIVLAVALSSQAQQQNKTNDIIGISHKYIDNNEQKLVYSFMVGISTELASQSMKNGGEMENSGSLIEISIYYEALRDGKQPRQLSELAASNAKTIMKRFQNADQTTINKYIEIGKNLHHNTAIYENKNSKSKQRLLEVMRRLDKTFKPINEEVGVYNPEDVDKIGREININDIDKLVNIALDILDKNWDFEVESKSGRLSARYRNKSTNEVTIRNLISLEKEQLQEDEMITFEFGGGTWVDEDPDGASSGTDYKIEIYETSYTTDLVEVDIFKQLSGETQARYREIVDAFLKEYYDEPSYEDLYPSNWRP